MGTNQVDAETRFERVRQILQKAAGDREAAFGGLRLWEFSRDELLESKLYGIRLIAPEKEAAAGHSCCGGAAEETRSSRSALVKGLRGESPFDGTLYPRLPFGASPLERKEIQTIAEWIDDNCPDKPTTIAYEASTGKSASVSVTSFARLDEKIRETFEVAPNEYKFQRGELKQRMNLDCMDEAQIEKLRYTFREMYELNKWSEDSRNYNNLALIHQNHCQHGWERFLPWHRIYLYEFEQAMQDIVPDVTMPYWDWTMPQYKPLQPDKGWIIPPSFQAFLTKDSLAFLNKYDIPVEKLEDMVGARFPTLTRFFDAVTERIGKKYARGEYRNRFVDALLDSNSLWYPLRYPGEFGGKTINQQIQYHYPSADDIEQLLSLRTFRDFGGGSLYNDSFGFMDQNPHNTLHIWTGGQNPVTEEDVNEAKEDRVPMPRSRNKSVQVAGRQFHKREDFYTQPPLGDMFSNLTASYDPIFWAVHTNVDRLWFEWQQRHPDSNPADLDAILTPWSYTTRDTLDMYRFGYEYVKSACVIPVGTEAPVGRFVSQEIAVDEKVRAAFREAEVRLHRVPQLHRSCFIRVFLNLPDADAQTLITHENYAGYLAVFGHGSCYGGPGHCDPPPRQRREYDLRPRHHNTPRNHRINVSECARRLFARGAASIQITLVVIGVDYQEDNELLRLEGISLNFLD
jgi:tyrosinase